MLSTDEVVMAIQRVRAKVPKGKKIRTIPHQPVVGTQTFVCFTDGSFRPPKFGAWAYAVLCGGKPYLFDYGAVRDTTVNRMELTAILKALTDLPANSIIQILTDSMYCVKSINEWAYSWEKAGWLTALGEPVKNTDLLMLVLQAKRRHNRVIVNHVKAHSGIIHNELVDFLAQVSSRKDKAQAEQAAEDATQLPAP